MEERHALQRDSTIRNEHAKDTEMQETPR